jgi:hypothetical protein
MVYLPCQPGTKWYKTTDPVVNEIVRYDPTIPWRNKWQDAFTPHYVSAQLSRLATGKDVSTENKMRSTLWPYNAVEGDIIRLASGSIVTVNSKVQELFDRAEQQKSCTGEEAKQLTALFQKMEETSFQFGAQNIVPQSADDVNYWLSTGTTVKRPDGRRVAQTAKKKAAKKGAKRASKRAAKKK